MTPLRSKPTLLAASLGLLLACAASAQTGKDAAQSRELEAARADLNRAAKRYAELSRENAPFDRAVFEREFERRFIQRPVLGVVLAPEPKVGVRIAAVTPDSAAAKAGLRTGDVLTSINDTKLDAASSEQRLAQAREQLRSLDTKAQVALAYQRDGRAATVRATPQLGERVVMMRDADGNPIERSLPLISPQVRSELIRLGPMGDCDGEDCHLPMLSEAFRWSGINLATVDPQLGRYFGTDRGVLVLSTGPELTGLQAGDVIQRIDGKPVGSPREAMAALRGKPEESRVDVTYLRDRKSATTKVTVPKVAMLRLPAPPAPPSPPSSPAPPAAPATPPTPPSAPTPPTPPQALTPPAPPAPPSPPAPPEGAYAIVIAV
ncbi:PDZ domain-containing protein [Lysobacter sp. LF1]|uniref:PDZ domain-containing protein n=1 Tax=Lysobacter stagni TaxID=3045172 RepID=A0ABT6XB35_9GAMM|nr:PDZ domain-containing protein [Lysobacter sp. LF1]MDI9237360.1 PDZ domain-containing protein [Lysobacter sp. LF1]